jgi:hypothetical protein
VSRPAWPQLDLFTPGATPRWRWTRPWLVSPHRPRAERELDHVRAHFPELDGTTVKVGLTKRRTILGLAAMGDEPCIWIRPRRIRRFVIAHELTHLLQARGLVPGGEKTADLLALTRGPAVIDFAPTYLAVPRGFTGPGRDRPVARGAAERLCALAREALAGRTARAAIRWFETRARSEALRLS